MRGHGIHSPFVYSLVREVFMPRSLMEGDESLYAALRSAGVGRKPARQLHNLFIFGGYTTFSINNGTLPETTGHLHIFTHTTSPDDIAAFPPDRMNDSTLCVIPGRGRKKKRICRKMVDNHPGISIDKRRYYLYFYALSYKKQHYKL